MIPGTDSLENNEDGSLVVRWAPELVVDDGEMDSVVEGAAVGESEGAAEGKSVSSMTTVDDGNAVGSKLVTDLY